MNYIDYVLSRWKFHGEKDEIVTALVSFLGEAGELANLLKKSWWHKKPLPREDLISELGDIWFYYNVILYFYGFSIEEIEAQNRRKLDERFRAQEHQANSNVTEEVS